MVSSLRSLIIEMIQKMCYIKLSDGYFYNYYCYYYNQSLPYFGKGFGMTVLYVRTKNVYCNYEYQYMKYIIERTMLYHVSEYFNQVFEFVMNRNKFKVVTNRYTYIIEPICIYSFGRPYCEHHMIRYKRNWERNKTLRITLDYFNNFTGNGATITNNIYRWHIYQN